MRYMLSRRLVIAAVAVAAVGLGQVPRADAGLSVSMQQTSGPSGATGVTNLAIVTAAGFSSASFSGSFGDFTLQTISVASNSGTTSPGDLSVNSLSVRNNSAGNATIVITSSDNSFTVPLGSFINVKSSLSSPTLTTVTGSGVFVSNANGVNSSPLSLSGFGAIATSFQVPRPGSNYTLGSVLTITLAAGETLQLTGDTVASATPEPATLALAGSALPLALIAFMRRRKAKA